MRKVNERMDQPLKGQVAFITGAGRGLGRGGAVVMAGLGAKVALVARTISELNETKERVEAVGGEALVLPTDLQDSGAIQAALQQVEDRWGPITALVNNAAVLDLLPLEKTTPNTWYRAFDINIHAAYHTIRHVYPQMVRRGDGSIHNVSSAAGWKGFKDETAYCSTKFALEGLTKALALEAMPKGILVTLSEPGIHTKPTSLTQKALKEQPAEQQAKWADPLVMGEGFAYLAYSRDPDLSGRSHSLYWISELVRKHKTLDLDVNEVLKRSQW